MSTIAQGHKRQQPPIILGSWIAILGHAEPPLDLGAARMVEVDDGDKRDEARLSLGGRGRGDGHCLGWGSGIRELRLICGPEWPQKLPRASLYN